MGRFVAEPRVTQKGQVTIPLEVRQRLGLKPRDRVRFEFEGDTVVIKAGTSRISRWFGSVTPPQDMQGMSAEELRDAYEQGVAEDVRREGL